MQQELLLTRRNEHRRTRLKVVERVVAVRSPVGTQHLVRTNASVLLLGVIGHRAVLGSSKGGGLAVY